MITVNKDEKIELVVEYDEATTLAINQLRELMHAHRPKNGMINTKNDLISRKIMDEILRIHSISIPIRYILVHKQDN